MLSLQALVVLLFAFNFAVSAQYDDRVDVVIIGGGSAGTYSAVRLAQQNKSVAVIEKENHLGGSVATFKDPKTNQTSDYGVILFHNSSIVNNFFAFLNTTLVVGEFGNATVENANFDTLQKVPPPPSSDPAAIGAAIQRFAALNFPTTPGYQDLPENIPDDLLLLLPDFLSKYNITAIADVLNLATLGYNLWEMPALYSIKLLNPTFLAALQTGFLTTANHNNQQAFNKARAYLGSQVYLRSEATKVVRQTDSVLVTIRTPSGNKTIQASHLLIAMPPYLQDLQQYLDLTSEETSLFGQLTNHTYTGAVIHNSGIPSTVSLRNANPLLPFSTFTLPGVTSFSANRIQGYTDTYYINNDTSPYLSDSQVESRILQTLDDVKKLYNFTSTNNTKIASFLRHSPFQQHVSAPAIKSGFYRDLVALQGQNRTYWTGATWVGHDSSAIWEYTEKQVLPNLL